MWPDRVSFVYDVEALTAKIESMCCKICLPRDLETAPSVHLSAQNAGLVSLCYFAGSLVASFGSWYV